MARPTPATSPVSSALARHRRWQALGAAAPQLCFGIRPRGNPPGEWVAVLPFGRHWGKAAALAAFTVPFCFPYVILLFDWSGGVTGGQDSAFDLLVPLFAGFFLLAWSSGVLLLLFATLATLFAGEVLHAQPGRLTAWVQVLGLGIGMRFPGSGLADLRVAEPDAAAEAAATAGDAAGIAAEQAADAAWRGVHLAFTFAGETVRVGSSLSTEQAEGLLRRIQELTVMGAGVGSPGPTAASGLAEGSTDAGAGRSPAHRPVDAIDAPVPGPSSLAALALILANLLPVPGVLLFGWQIGEIFLLYWAESAIIGFFALARMVVVGRWAALFFGPFFCGVFGAFMTAHLLFVLGLITGFGTNAARADTSILAELTALWPALLGLFISHGISFRRNFLGRGEYAFTDIRRQMTAPYGRIAVMQVTIILGGMAAMTLGNPLPSLLLLIGLKTAVDLRAHLRHHRRAVPAPTR